MWLLVGFVRRDLRVKCFFEIARDLIWRLLDLHNNVNACRKFKIFNVKVAKVNTISVKGKQKRMGRSVGYRPDWKKAIVTLEGDKTIEFFEGLF